jgi:hypothetical protein
MSTSIMSIAQSVIGRPSNNLLPGDGGCVKPFPGGGPTPLPPFPFPGKGDAHAQTQGNQLHDIAEGVRNGSITAQEAEKLLAQQKQLADATQAAKADGKVSFFERLQLSAMERSAGRAIDGAKNNSQQDFFAGFDPTAQRQANQIDRIAHGRENGNITHSEASKLLGQQTDIADQRGDVDSRFESFMLDRAQDQASGDIRTHSRPGTQGGLTPTPVPVKPLPIGDAHARTQAGQLHDIADGVRNGSITAQEAEKLLAQQKQLADATQAAKADGKVTFFEKIKLAALERQAGSAINQAKHNFQRDPFARIDTSAQTQANQIDRIANGRQNGNITHSEASKLLGQQTKLADSRGDADTAIESLMLGREMHEADRDIRRHSRPGTQVGGFDPLPFFRGNIAG